MTDNGQEMLRLAALILLAFGNSLEKFTAAQWLAIYGDGRDAEVAMSWMRDNHPDAWRQLMDHINGVQQ